MKRRNQRLCIPMKFLADENFPRPLVNIIRSFGHSVKTVQQKNLQGSSDEAVRDITQVEKRILLTFDKDFLKNQQKSLKVIIFDFPRILTSEIIPLIDSFLSDLEELKFIEIKVLKFSKHGLETTK